jgi:hypothetical protein
VSALWKTTKGENMLTRFKTTLSLAVLSTSILATTPVLANSITDTKVEPVTPAIELKSGQVVDFTNPLLRVKHANVRDTRQDYYDKTTGSFQFSMYTYKDLAYTNSFKQTGTSYVKTTYKNNAPGDISFKIMHYKYNYSLS